MSRARLDGPSEARMLALSESIAQAVSDHFGASRHARGLLALVQEHDGDLHDIVIELQGRMSRSGSAFGVGITLTIPALGIDHREPVVIVTSTPRAPRPRKRRKSKRPAA